MTYEKSGHHSHDIHRQQDDWDEVHNQLLTIQKKSLAVSDPGDADEKEADEVAKKAMNGQSSEIHGTSGTVNRKGEGAAETTAEFQSKLENNKGSGQSLDDATRNEMDSKMNADFSSVKVHDGSEAHGMSESINAKAFTHGQDVFFKQGEFNTTSQQGKELLAHELVHTQQQKNTVNRKIQRQTIGHTPGSDYKEGAMRQDFDLHEENLVDLMKNGADAYYFKDGEQIKFDGKKSAVNEFWIYVTGTAYLRNQQSAGESKSGWIRRSATTMTLGLYEGVNIGDKSERLPVTTNSNATLYEGMKSRVGKGAPTFTFKQMLQENSSLYFQQNESIIVGDVENGKLQNGEGPFQWYEVEGTAHYQTNPAKAIHTKGYIKDTQLNLPARPSKENDEAQGYSTLGNIGVNRPFDEVKTITLHQTNSPVNADPLPGVRSKIAKPTNQFANYTIGGTGQTSLVTPVNEQISHNPGKNVTDTTIYDIDKPVAPPATSTEKDALVKKVKTKTDDLYARGWMPKETVNFWNDKSLDDGNYPGQLYAELVASGWNLYIKQPDPNELTGNVNYNRTSVGIEMTGQPEEFPLMSSSASAATYRDTHIKPSTKFSPNFKAQLMAMTPSAFYTYMEGTKDESALQKKVEGKKIMVYKLYPDINAAQKYSSWKLVSAIAADQGIPMNAQTIVAHGETDQKNLSEGVGNKEFILAMVDYRATYSKIKIYVDTPQTLTATQEATYKEAAELLALIDGPQLTSGPEYDRINAFFTDFYKNKKKLDDLAFELKLR